MKRIGISLAIIAAIAIGPVAITSAGASLSGTDAPPSGAVIVDNVS